MSISRIFLISLALVIPVALAAALSRQTAQSVGSASLPPPALVFHADPLAQQAFDNALRALDRNRSGWMEMTLWQHVHLPEFPLQAEGIYLAGPERRLHLNLKVNFGGTSGRMETVCDGSTLWETLRLGNDGKKTVRKVELKNERDALQAAEEGNAIYRKQAFTGILPLMQEFQRLLIFTHKEDLRWQDRPVVRLDAVWSPAADRGIRPSPAHAWPMFQPRQCRIYLDARTSWPHRLEWWGPARTLHEDALLFEMEFRNPRWNVAMSLERRARVFQFNPD